VARTSKRIPVRVSATAAAPRRRSGAWISRRCALAPASLASMIVWSSARSSGVSFMACPPVGIVSLRRRATLLYGVEMSPPTERRSEKLTVASIVEAAHELVAEAGVGALSIRRLGNHLGVDPMAVYHHIPNK